MSIDPIDFMLEQRQEEEAARQEAAQNEAPPQEAPPPAEEPAATTTEEPTPSWHTSDSDSYSDNSSYDYSSGGDSGAETGGSSGGGLSSLVSFISGWFAPAAPRDETPAEDLVELADPTDISAMGVRPTATGRKVAAEQREQVDAELAKIAKFNAAEQSKGTDWRKDDDPVPAPPEQTWAEDDVTGGITTAGTSSDEPDKIWVDDELQPQAVAQAKNTYMDTFTAAVTEVVASAKDAVRQEIQGVRERVEAAKDQYTGLTMTVAEAEEFLSGKVEAVVQQRFEALSDPSVQIDDFMPIMLGINKDSVTPKEAADTVKDVLSGKVTAKSLVLDQFSPYKFLEEVTKDEGCTEALVVLFKSYDENKRVETIADFVINSLKGLEGMLDLANQVD